MIVDSTRPPMPGWRITAFIRQAGDGAVEVIDISPKGFVRRAHVGQSYEDEGAAKAAISESFRVWSGNTALSATVAVVFVDEPPDSRLTATPDDASAPEAENESGERISDGPRSGCQGRLP